MARNTSPYSNKPTAYAAEDDTGNSIATKVSAGAFGLLVIFGLITLWLGVYTIDQGYVGIIKRNGAVTEVVNPGLHVKMPWIDTVDEIEVRERAAHLDLQTSSGDPMLLPISATVNWVANKDAIVELYSEYGSLEQFEQRIIIPAFNDGIKSATAMFTVNKLLTDRTKLGEEALRLVKAKTPASVMTITGLYIVDVKFPEKYTQQILDKQVAAEAALTEEYKLKQQRFQSMQETQTAEAKRDAAKAIADGKAYEIKVQGEATASAIELKGKSLAQNPLVVDYEKVQRWSGTFPATFMGGKDGANILWNLSGSQNDAPAGGKN